MQSKGRPSVYHKIITRSQDTEDGLLFLLQSPQPALGHRGCFHLVEGDRCWSHSCWSAVNTSGI